MYGSGRGKFASNFDAETFAIAPGSGSAPVVHEAARSRTLFQNASRKAKFAPIHTFHLGLCSTRREPPGWLPGRGEAVRRDHRAGIKALCTRNCSEDRGPLRNIAP